MNNKIFLITAALLAACTIFAADRQTCRDAQGRTAGAETTGGNCKTYRDAPGRTAGTAKRALSGNASAIASGAETMSFADEIEAKRSAFEKMIYP